MRLKLKYIDSHCHIDFFSNEEIEEISKEVHTIYGASISFESSLRVLEISKKFENIKASLGIHPEYFEYYHEYEKIKNLIIENRNSIYAVGEVGLPYFSIFDKNPSEKTKLHEKGLTLLENFIILAKELDLPLVLHATQSTAIDAYNLLKKYEIKKALFHWLHCDLETSKKIFESGYFASVSLDIQYNSEYLEFVKHIPIKNLLIESDSPWKYDDNNSRPKDIEKTSKVISKLLGYNETEFLEILSKNIDNFTKITVL